MSLSLLSLTHLCSYDHEFSPTGSGLGAGSLGYRDQQVPGPALKELTVEASKEAGKLMMTNSDEILKTEKKDVEERGREMSMKMSRCWAGRRRGARSSAADVGTIRRGLENKSDSRAAGHGKSWTCWGS